MWLAISERIIIWIILFYYYFFGGGGGGGGEVEGRALTVSPKREGPKCGSFFVVFCVEIRYYYIV